MPPRLTAILLDLSCCCYGPYRPYLRSNPQSVVEALASHGCSRWPPQAEGGNIIALRRSNSAHLHRPWRATSVSLPGFFHSRRMPALREGGGSAHAAVRRTSLMVTSPALFSCPAPILISLCQPRAVRKRIRRSMETSVN